MAKTPKILNILPTVQRFTTPGSGTYITPGGVKYIRVIMVGGGGGASGSGTTVTTGNNGSAGVDSTFGGTLLLAAKGGGGLFQSAGGAGGGIIINSPAITVCRVNGSYGGGYMYPGNGALQLIGGSGGSTPFGIANGHGSAAQGTQAGVANTGQGGSGALVIAVNGYTGSGGGGAGYLEAIINNPSATYAWAVGDGGAGGALGTSGTAGAAGGSGYIEITEFYN